MDWKTAVEQMRAGHNVRRAVHANMTPSGQAGGVPVFDGGTEPLQIVAAWSADDAPASVFRGAWSRELCVPNDDDRAATDWQIA